jgi:hypothetical protein
MSMHRRWLLSSAGQVFLASLVGSSASGNSTPAPVRTPTPPPCPTPPHYQVPAPPPGTYGQAFTDLIDTFYNGVVVAGYPNPQWGLNPYGTSSSLLLDPNRTLLGSAGGHLEEHYKERLTSAIAASISSDSYGLLREQSALLGRLTRCMWELQNKISATPLDPKHLNWAREALGFALNSQLKGCLNDKCHFTVPYLQRKGRVGFKAPELDNGCILC